MTPKELRSSLLDRGYVEIPEHKGLRPGVRVSHTGERYSSAIHNGTATVEQVFKSPRLIQGREDIEIIVKRDKPTWGSTHGQWADYHAVITNPSE